MSGIFNNKKVSNKARLEKISSDIKKFKKEKKELVELQANIVKLSEAEDVAAEEIVIESSTMTMEKAQELMYILINSYLLI